MEKPAGYPTPLPISCAYHHHHFRGGALNFPRDNAEPLAVHFGSPWSVGGQPPQLSRPTSATQRSGCHGAPREVLVEEVGGSGGSHSGRHGGQRRWHSGLPLAAQDLSLHVVTPQSPDLPPASFPSSRAQRKWQGMGIAL